MLQDIELINCFSMHVPRIFENIYVFYRDGLKSMTIGRTLWAIVIIKLFIMFGILRVFFFSDYLNSRFASEKDKANHVRTELIEKATTNRQNN